MSAPDLDVIKDIPGYKIILKAILKSQIQQLVEQLAVHTEEESVILTASVTDGTLSHLGSDSGKSFLKDHEDVKSQFLGFCLKKHHRKKQDEDRLEALRKEEEVRLEALRNMPPAQTYHPRPQFPPSRSPRHSMPGLVRGRAARYEPYPVDVIRVSRPPVGVQPPVPSTSAPSAQAIVKVETLDDESLSNPGNSDSISANPGSHPSTSQDDSQNIPNQDNSFNDSALDRSDTFSQEGGTGDSGEHSQEIKVEAISEADLELEITGVEPGARADQYGSADSWGGEGSGEMGFDTSGGATGSAADMQGYNYAPCDQDQKYTIVIKTETELPNSQLDDEVRKETVAVKTEMQNLGSTLTDGGSWNMPQMVLPTHTTTDIPKNTHRKNIWTANLFEKWRDSILTKEAGRDTFTELEAVLRQKTLLSMTDEELNNVVAAFLTSVKKESGEDYSYDTLYSVACGLQRYLKSNNKYVDFFQGGKFTRVRQAVEKAIQGRSSLGKPVKKLDIITEEQECMLWAGGFLGTSNPQALLDAMFWVVGSHFGIRGGDELRNLTFDNFRVKVEANNSRNLYFIKSDNSNGTPEVAGIVQENTEMLYKCPVRIFLEYQSKIPEYLRNKGFYYRPYTSPASVKGNWYTSKPIGHNSLRQLVHDLMIRAGFRGSYTNNSLKAQPSKIATRFN